MVASLFLCLLVMRGAKRVINYAQATMTFATVVSKNNSLSDKKVLKEGKPADDNKVSHTAQAFKVEASTCPPRVRSVRKRPPLSGAQSSRSGSPTSVKFAAHKRGFSGKCDMAKGQKD